VQPRPKLGRRKDDLDRLLTADEGKPARERLTLIRPFEDQRALGYAGGYDAVRRYARAWRKSHVGAAVAAYVPLSFAPGEAFQFDWSHEIVLLNGTTVTVKVAHLRLCHSRMFFVRAYPRETREMVFDARARFHNVVELVNRLEAEARANRGRIADHLVSTAQRRPRARCLAAAFKKLVPFLCINGKASCRGSQLPPLLSQI
jgi:hypothetical protein